jgi:membrane protein DedA with SNARE-associated domain
MTHSAFDWLRAFIANYGYWAVALALLCESTGIPVPGEITLLLASFLAYSEHRLHLGWIIVAGTSAGSVGGNLGYAVGLYGGRPLLDRYQRALRVPPATLQRGEEIFARHGAVAVFLSRFIFGLRVFAGPLAGVLRMPWQTFTLFNFLGAAAWVTVISSAGYLFGQHWHSLLRTMQRFNIAVLVVAASAILFLYWRHRRSPPSR